VNFLLVDDEEITLFNRQYFQRNRPTNVISFPMGPESPAPAREQILGDVVISAETAERHASAVGETAEEEIFFLMIHGVLHLVGYAHEGGKAERREMEAKEKELFLLIARARRRTPVRQGKN
jgi:probable rRNA maturation factor